MKNGINETNNFFFGMTNVLTKIQPMVTKLFQIQLITKPVTRSSAASKNQFSCYLIQIITNVTEKDSNLFISKMQIKSQANPRPTPSQPPGQPLANPGPTPSPVIQAKNFVLWWTKLQLPLRKCCPLLLKKGINHRFS
jgi:hypothetical protein